MITATLKTKTTIQIKVETKKVLDRYSKKGETYDGVIQRILKNHEYVVFMEEQYKILDKEKNWTKLEKL